MRNYLFCKKKLSELISHNQSLVKTKVNQYNALQFESTPLEQIENVLLSHLEIKCPNIIFDNLHQDDPIDKEVDACSLGEDVRRGITDKSHKIMIPGLLFNFKIPFEGDSGIFDYSPSTWSSVSPWGVIDNNCINMTFHVASDTCNISVIENQVHQNVKELKEYIDRVSKDINQYTVELKKSIRKEISHRLEKLNKDKDLKKSLTIPIKQKNDIPKDIHHKIKIEPKIIPPSLEKTVSQPISILPSYSLEEKHYEQILKIIKNMSDVFQKIPKPFEKLDEESLRTYFLVSLNGIYEGNATGETFNFQGKTDIMVKVENKTVFIAECKFWKGEESVTKAVDQLLSYLSWNDTKTSLIIFNRNKNFTNVLNQIDPILKKHPNFIKEWKKTNSQTEFKYILRNNNDHQQQVFLTVLCYDVPE